MRLIIASCTVLTSQVCLPQVAQVSKLHVSYILVEITLYSDSFRGGGGKGPNTHLFAHALFSHTNLGIRIS